MSSESARPRAVTAAYLGVILIWSTTPLATKWSGEGPGFLFGAASRMTIGILCVFGLLAWRRVKLPLHARAWQHYFAGAISVYGAMCLSYWAAQQVPSGWISVIYGLTPLITAVLSRVLLGEHSLTPRKLTALTICVMGLWVIYGSATRIGQHAVLGIGALLVGAVLHGLSAVLVKRLNANVPALASVAGTLLFAWPAYVLTWWLLDGHWPAVLPLKSLASITYLGVVATTLGFSWYFFVLKHLTATQVAMIALLTPVLALAAGFWLNDEPLTPRIAAGTALILAGMVLHEIRRFRASA